jgi:hypothetical protein
MKRWPCHKLPRAQWCDSQGGGGFMGHTCVTPTPENMPYDPRYDLLLPLVRRLHISSEIEMMLVAKAIDAAVAFGVLTADQYKDRMTAVAMVVREYESIRDSLRE